VTSLDPSAKFSSHDKIEGVAQLNGGRTIILSNDSDFGINELTQNATVPFTPHVKVSRPRAGRTRASSWRSTCQGARRARLRRL
jgi:hypothetical protein